MRSSADEDDAMTWGEFKRQIDAQLRDDAVLGVVHREDGELLTVRWWHGANIAEVLHNGEPWRPARRD